ncbi:MAG: hypothetical protein RIQ44_231, partial [Actinomycetota bacterium]
MQIAAIILAWVLTAFLVMVYLKA